MLSPSFPEKGAAFYDRPTNAHYTYDGQDWVERPMKLEEIIQQCLDDSAAWFPEKAQDVPFLVLAIAGEIGELANLVKKVERGTHTYDELQLKIWEETTDVFIYLMDLVGVWQNRGFDLVEAYRQKREANAARFSRGSTFVRTPALEQSYVTGLEVKSDS